MTHEYLVYYKKILYEQYYNNFVIVFDLFHPTTREDCYVLAREHVEVVDEPAIFQQALDDVVDDLFPLTTVGC